MTDETEQNSAPLRSQLDLDNLSYEHTMRALAQVVTDMENPQISLENSVAAYRQGQALLAHARQLLDVAEQSLIELDSHFTNNP